MLFRSTHPFSKWKYALVLLILPVPSAEPAAEIYTVLWSFNLSFLFCKATLLHTALCSAYLKRKNALRSKTTEVHKLFQGKKPGMSVMNMKKLDLFIMEYYFNRDLLSEST